MKHSILKGHGGQIWSVSICRESPIVAAGSDDHTIRLWDAKTKEAMDPLEGHEAAVKAVVFAPRGRFLASAAKDRLVKMWNPSWQVEYVLQGHRGPVHALAFSSDCRWLASGGGQADKAGEVILWDLAKAAVLKRLEGHAAEVLALAIAPDRQTLVSSDAAGVINLWDLTQLEVRLTWTAHDGPVWALAIHPDGNALVTGGQDGRVKFWSLDSGRPMGNRRGHSSGVLTAAFSTHGRQLAIGCQDGHVKLWNIASKGPWIKLARLEKPVYSLTYSPERILLAAGPDKDVTFWQTKTQVKLAPQIGSPLESAQRERFLPPPKTATVRKLQELMSSLKDAMPEEIALRQKRFRDDLEAAEVS